MFFRAPSRRIMYDKQHNIYMLSIPITVLKNGNHFQTEENTFFRRYSSIRANRNCVYRGEKNEIKYAYNTRGNCFCNCRYAFFLLLLFRTLAVYFVKINLIHGHVRVFFTQRMHPRARRQAQNIEYIFFFTVQYVHKTTFFHRAW